MPKDFLVASAEIMRNPTNNTDFEQTSGRHFLSSFITIPFMYF